VQWFLNELQINQMRLASILQCPICLHLFSHPIVLTCTPKIAFPFGYEGAISFKLARLQLVKTRSAHVAATWAHEEVQYLLCGCLRLAYLRVDYIEEITSGLDR